MTGWRRQGLLIAGVVILGLVLGACAGAAASNSSEDTQAPKAGGAPLIITDSVVTGHANVAEKDAASKVCVQNSRFQRNQMVVWRIKVIDPTTGQPMDDAALTSVQVKLPDGQLFDAEYGDHPPDQPTDHFWATSWTIPKDYPSGTVAYTVVATAKDGRTSEYLPFNVGLSLLTVIPGSVPIIKSE